MSILRVSDLAARPMLTVVLRYGQAVFSVALALAIALTLRHYNLPHPFTSFSLAAIAITFWYAGTGPGIVALVLASLAMRRFFIPIFPGGPSRESYLVIYGIFGLLISWFSTSRRRAERLLVEARNNLEVRVAERTVEVTQANDKLKLLLELTNNAVSNLEIHEVLRAVIASVRQIMLSDFAGLGLPDTDPAQLGVYALDAGGDVNLSEVEPLLRGESAPANVLRAGKLWAGKMEDLLESRTEKNIFLATEIKTVCVLPILSRNRALGIMVLGRRRDDPYTQDQIDFVEQITKQIAIAVENALSYREISELKDKLTQEKLYLEDEIRTTANFEEIIGLSNELRRSLKNVETVAPTDSTVLIYGETGTGKELIARAIHNLSPRRGKTFVKLNCAAIPTGLLESELFGHEKGSFTGAIAQRIGRLELANGGTLFLDEIGEIPLELQPKLLRVLQEREFERLGSSRTLRTDVRLVAATNRDLAAMVADQKFRSDLFFRLNVFPIQIPPLRERQEDIPLLVRHFSEEFARRMNKKIETIPSETMKTLCRYSWPGNIRELQNVIERAVILSHGSTLYVPVAELPTDAHAAPPAEGARVRSTTRRPVRSILTDVDRDQIIQALNETGGLIGGPNGAASRLGLKRTTLITRMKKLGIIFDGTSQSHEVSASTSEGGDS
jgi:formate hydrogenlyase transcriptional activator